MIRIFRHFNTWAVFIPPLLTTILFVISGLILHFQYADSLRRLHELELVQLAKLCEQSISFLNHRATPEELADIANMMASVSQTRISILDNDGRYLADSNLSKLELQQADSELSLPEIRNASQRGMGIFERTSVPLKADMLFAAIQYRTLFNSGYIRTARPSSVLHHDLLAQRVVMIVLYIIILLMTLVISLLSINFINQRVRKDQELLKQRVQERTSQIAMLHQLGTMLTACKSREEAFEIVGRAGKRMLPDFFGALSLYRASRNVLEVTVTWNGDWQGDRFFQSRDCWGLRTGKSHFSENGIVSCTHGNGPADQTMLCIPLMAQGETIGVMHIAGRLETFSPENRNLAAAIVEHTGLAMANLQLQESLRNQATRDSLTGLYNRRFLQEFFESELSRSARRHKPIGILMLDVDHFKKLNDNFGHDAGDAVLSELGRLLLQVLRSEDILCRYGGEEFVILLPETDLPESLSVAAKIHERLHAVDMKSGSLVIGRVNVSIGAACYPDHGRTQDELIKAADEALYSAKRKGRNRTEPAVPVSDIPDRQP